MNTVSPRTAESWVIEPRRGGTIARARELWRYRRLTRFFAARALEKLYRRTVLGWSWLLIRPLFPLLVKTMIFGGLLSVPSEGVPYFLFLLVATTVWELFAQSMMWATRSLELNRGLIARIYVPRLILPVAMISPALLTLGIHVCVLLGTLLYYRITDGVWYVSSGLQVLWAVPALLLATTLAVGIGLWTSVPALVARDVRFTLNYVLSFWIFLTPVMYPLSSVSPRWQLAMAFNPMTGPVELFKWAVLGIGKFEPLYLAISTSVTILVAVAGLAFFARAESDAADRV